MIHAIGSPPHRRLHRDEVLCTIEDPAVDVGDDVNCIFHESAEFIEDMFPEWYCPACTECSIQDYLGEA